VISDLLIIGSGNVATALAKAFVSVNKKVRILGRNEETVAQLSSSLSIPGSCSWEDFDFSVDAVFLAVTDDALPTIVGKMGDYTGIIAHTSGSVGLEVFGSNKTGASGYFYPLQTFRSDYEVDMKSCPLFVNSNDEATTKSLLSLAEEISDSTHRISDEQKANLHLSAVVVNNFVNHLFALTYDYLHQSELSFEYLQPIIQTTIDRALVNDPALIQTGPAIRNDDSTLERHISKLEKHELLQDTYAYLSAQIQHYYDGEDE